MEIKRVGSNAIGFGDSVVLKTRCTDAHIKLWGNWSRVNNPPVIIKSVHFLYSVNDGFYRVLFLDKKEKSALLSLEQLDESSGLKYGGIRSSLIKEIISNAPEIKVSSPEVLKSLRPDVHKSVAAIIRLLNKHR